MSSQMAIGFLADDNNSLFSWLEMISRLGACVITLGRDIVQNVEPGNGSR